MTALLALPSLSGDDSVENNEDWLDAVAFWYDDDKTQPVPLDGISFEMLVRATADDPNIYFTATTQNGFLSILSSGATLLTVSGGFTHAVGDVLTLSGGVFNEPATVEVTGVTSGVITAARLLSLGSYFVLPSNPVAQGVSTGGGTLASFNLTYLNNALAITVPSATFPKTLKPGSYVYEISGSDGINVRDVLKGNLTVNLGTVR